MRFFNLAAIPQFWDYVQYFDSTDVNLDAESKTLTTIEFFAACSVLYLVLLPFKAPIQKLVSNQWIHHEIDLNDVYGRKKFWKSIAVNWTIAYLIWGTCWILKAWLSFLEFI